MLLWWVRKLDFKFVFAIDCCMIWYDNGDEVIVVVVGSSGRSNF